ncbi:MBL fold metallo-hydrolase [Oscillochloris sp. ZM17-4]|uniref:MBL fold metallo-hydrolase n=1 Tax=Oscillochloris sp. ZM17-4 TaxID=2866714 RepID=UPI001C739D0D|nr:MBL fold metallo-hydrolase [Oscillochloris sp. ZM17-4]MBX0327601.1 MBL fold metallo-hydrolase [Oscillochloris sp. ZM17-4]
MAFTVTSLASGSSGNALVIQRDDAAILIDCGIALRTMERLLRYRGIAPESIRALLLTHEHGDHALSAAALARRYGAPVICNAATRAALGAELDGVAVELLPVGERACVGPFDVSSFRLRHDAADPVGYRVAADGAAMALAVDLGSWDDETAAALSGADLLVVEANHDRELLRASAYPWATRQRIFGPLGHLDNMQCGELLARAGVRAGHEVWLAHLSEQTNSPRMATAGVGRVLELANRRGVSLRALPRRSVNGPGGAPAWHSDTRLLQQTMF